MGINSTGVAYGFGQFGSAITDTSSVLRPPKGLVIVAITALSDTAFEASSDGLVSELDKHDLPLSLTTADTASGVTGGSAHEFGDHTPGNAHTNGSSNAAGVITLSTASTVVTEGMFVESATMCPYSLTNPYMIKSVDSTTQITVTTKGDRGSTIDVAADLASGSAEAIYFFRKHGQGFGGLLMDASDTIPKGVTIYGRWTEFDLSSGRVIAYFGK